MLDNCAKIRENYSEWKISRDQNWWAHVGLCAAVEFFLTERDKRGDKRFLGENWKFYWAFFQMKLLINLTKVLKFVKKVNFDRRNFSRKIWQNFMNFEA
jgi:hypothetical protein